MKDRNCMRWRVGLALLMALSASGVGAATVMDPDAPRFGDALRVLGMRDQVEVLRLDEYAALDPEPLYLARAPGREAVFREGEDLCMAKGKLGHFVACNRDLARAVERVIADPIRGDGVTIWPAPPAYHGSTPHRPGGSPGVPWVPGRPGVTPPPVAPPPIITPPPPAPIPLPASGMLLAGALLAVALIRRKV